VLDCFIVDYYTISAVLNVKPYQQAASDQALIRRV
jgi:hypothetical protein